VASARATPSIAPPPSCARAWLPRLHDPVGRRPS
jgi:hypothetical protein